MANVCDECGDKLGGEFWGITRYKTWFSHVFGKKTGDWSVCGISCATKLMKRVDQERGRGVGYSSGRKG